MGQNLTRIIISIEELIRFIMMLFISINYQLEKVTFFGSVLMRITQLLLINCDYLLSEWNEIKVCKFVIML